VTSTVQGVDISPLTASSSGQSLAMSEFEAQSDQLNHHHGDSQQEESLWEQQKSSLPGTGVQPGSRTQEVWVFVLPKRMCFFGGLHDTTLHIFTFRGSLQLFSNVLSGGTKFFYLLDLNFGFKENNVFF
jgi:hypothetical protein